MTDQVVMLLLGCGLLKVVMSHSSILVEKSKYFADRLSDTWPTCQILDARSCVEVYCQESDVDYNITLLRVLYIPSSVISESWLGAAVELGCLQTVSSCVEYLEAVPWEEAEEEEILAIIPALGPIANPVLSRLQPVDQAAIWRIFVSAIRFATSSPPPSLRDLKSSAQEYMLAEDDDAPLLTSCDEEASDTVVKLIKKASSKVETLEGKLKVIEVVAKVLEAVGYGNVVLPTAKRLHLVKVWLPFARVMIDTAPSNTEEDISRLKVDCEVWKTLESAFVSIILALPSGDQAEILTEWLDNQHIQYPDLTEAFEVWCYRTKVARKRLAPFGASLV